jgi:hypothetical protein
MKFIQSIIDKIVATIKAEPAVAAGGLAGVIAVVYQWIQVNHITNLRQGVTLAAPIVLSFVIRLFVTPTVKVDAKVAAAIAAVTPAPPAA